MLLATALPRCVISARQRTYSPSACSRTTASPVVLIPGSSLTRTGWTSPPTRSLSRIVNGYIRWTTARRRSRSCRPLLRAGHQGLLLLIDDEDAQDEPLCIGARKGLVTESGLGLSYAMRMAATAPSDSLPSTMLPTGIAGESVSGRPRRVCNPPFEWSGLRKHPDVGLEPVRQRRNLSLVSCGFYAKPPDFSGSGCLP